MPSVFRIVFIAAIAGEVRLPKNLFLFVYFKRKDKLLFQSLIHTVQLLAEFAFYPYYNTNSYPSQLWKSKSSSDERKTKGKKRKMSGGFPGIYSSKRNDNSQIVETEQKRMFWQSPLS